MRKKTSAIWTKLDDEEFSKLVKESFFYKDVLESLGLQLKGGNNNTLKRRINSLGLSVSHFKKGCFVSNESRRVTLEKFEAEWLIVGKKRNGQELKKHLYKFKLKDEKCEECDQSPTWNGKPLVLQLDHINGVNLDNRLINLRILCPHCHSQTGTFAGRNNRLKKKKHYCVCGESKSKKSNSCRECKSKKEIKLTVSREDLHKMVCEDRLPFTKIGEKFNVSDNAIRKRCKKYGIDPKTRKKI